VKEWISRGVAGGDSEAGARLETLLRLAVEHLHTVGGDQNGACGYEAPGVHALVVTASAHSRFLIPEEIFSAHSQPWIRLHLFDLTAHTTPATEVPTLRRICAATGGAYVDLVADGGEGRMAQVEKVTLAHFPPYQGSLRVGHLSGFFSLHPNPLLRPPRPGRPAFPRLASVVGFFDYTAVQNAPIRSQFVILGPQTSLHSFSSKASTTAPLSSGAPIPGLGLAAPVTVPAPALDPVLALLRAVLKSSNAAEPPLPGAPALARLGGTSPAVLVMLGSWALSGGGEESEGGVGFVTVEADARGGYHLVLTVLDDVTAHDLPGLIGNQTEVSLNGVGFPLTSVESMERSITKVTRYAKKLPEQVERFRTECSKVQANVAMYGLAAACNASLLKILESELESKHALLSAAKERKRGFVEGNQAHQHHTRKAKVRHESAGNEIDKEVTNLELACRTIQEEVSSIVSKTDEF